ncbi:MAG: hypothetical protein WC622_12000 [Pedobacter sp.]|jgi:hypothetical protein|uniref:hypothetical protein n=1 Tax=Pedobacter sp. TaxID=1411316 RepID=UPI0035621D0E
MKNKFLFLLPILCLFLSSCFEIEETYTINENGTYVVNYNLDMGGIMGLVTKMAPDSVKETSNYKLGRDTVINLSTMPDSLKENMSAKELEIVNNTNMHMQMKMADGIFKIGFTNTGKSIDNLKYFLSNFGNTIQKAKVGKLINTPGAETSSESTTDKEMPFNNKEFEYIITNKSFERKIKPEVLAVQKEKNQKNYDIMKTMDIKMTSTIIINLPRPAMSIENSKATLSADKKQFKLELNMLEAINNPETLNFKINY